jgi:hypothetical protein
MAEGERGDRPDSGVKARGGIASAPGYRHLVDEWKRVFARYQPELDQELLRIAGRPLTDADIDAAAAVLVVNNVRAPTDLPLGCRVTWPGVPWRRRWLSCSPALSIVRRRITSVG